MKLELGSAATKINAELAQAEADFQSALQHAINAGHMLIDVKAQLKHGEFGSWVRKNIDVGEREARNYMRLAENRQRVADLPSIRAAVAYLASPKLEPPSSDSDLDRIRAELKEHDQNPPQEQPPEDDSELAKMGAHLRYLLVKTEHAIDRRLFVSRFAAAAANAVEDEDPDVASAFRTLSITGKMLHTAERHCWDDGPSDTALAILANAERVHEQARADLDDACSKYTDD